MSVIDFAVDCLIENCSDVALAKDLGSCAIQNYTFVGSFSLECRLYS